MSSYTKSTNFASKDSLSTGNPLKIVKGTEIDTEFNNISTAIATKADTASPTLTGTPLAPTAAAGTNTTQLATTAFVRNELLASVYPVGSIYINAGVTTNPGTLLGFGTWVAFGAGKVAIGIDATNALFDALEETGGSADAVVVSHTHTATVTDPGHTHTTNAQRIAASGGISGGGSGEYAATINSATTGITVANSTTGVSGTNANYQPFITVAMWKRTA